jgi:hypothetical protein
MNTLCESDVQQAKKLNSPESASKLYRPSDRRLSAKLLPTCADRGRHVVSVTDPYGRILAFLDQTHHIFFQVAPQLYLRAKWTRFRSTRHT